MLSHKGLAIPTPGVDYQPMRGGEGTSFAEIFRSEADNLTRILESQGFHVWFTCEVAGTEYRLAARRDVHQVGGRTIPCDREHCYWCMRDDDIRTRCPRVLARAAQREGR